MMFSMDELTLIVVGVMIVVAILINTMYNAYKLTQFEKKLQQIADALGCEDDPVDLVDVKQQA